MKVTNEITNEITNESQHTYEIENANSDTFFGVDGIGPRASTNMCEHDGC